MTEREASIARAAIRVYATKGVRRTTMTDIAQEAGVTRQTVYNAFPNTDEVLRAAIRLYIAGLWEKTHAAWQTSETLEAKLDVLFAQFVIDPWEFVHSSEEAAQLEQGYNDVGREEITAARAHFCDEVAPLFAPFEEALAQQGTSSRATAHYIKSAMEGIKYHSANREDLLVAIATLKASLLALTR